MVSCYQHCHEQLEAHFSRIRTQPVVDRFVRKLLGREFLRFGNLLLPSIIFAMFQKFLVMKLIRFGIEIVLHLIFIPTGKRISYKTDLMSEWYWNQNIAFILLTAITYSIRQTLSVYARYICKIQTYFDNLWITFLVCLGSLILIHLTFL